MAGGTSVRRPSGIVIEVSGSAVLDSERATSTRLEFGAFPPPRTRGPRRRGRSRAAPSTTAAEAAAIRDALAGAQIERIDAVPLRTSAPPERAVLRPRRRRRGGLGPAPSRASAVSRVSVGVPLKKDERSVVLLEHDGVYSWHVPDAVVPVRTPRTRTKRRRGAPAPRGRIAYFRLDLPASRPEQARPAGRPRRRGLKKWLAGKAMAYVFRFVAKPVLKGVSKWLERHVCEGPVHVNGLDPAAWTALAGNAVVPLRSAGAPHVLVLVHGTFSSTVGSFGALAGTDEGKAFLDAALGHYDCVIGWNHKTLSVTPTDNARDLLAWCRAQKWRKPPVIDAIAFSRGGLVWRSFVEDLLPRSSVKAVIRRVVFVGCTNGGTELARPANWNRFADIYVNLAAAGARALAVVPGFTAAGTILSEGIQGVGSLLKVLASSVVDDNAVPGLSAMNPGGSFVKRINAKQPGQPMPDDVYYCAVTSNFDPDEASDVGRSSEIPPGFLLRVADKGADALYGKPNDLVVHVEAMTQIDPDVGAYVRERLDYGTNGVVHHCRYFAEAETADALSRWLQVPSG